MPESVSKLYRALVSDGRVSLAVLDTTQVVNEAIVRHALSPVAAAALGRTMTAAAYLEGWLKEETSTLSLSVNGGGAGGKICAAADGALRVRGYLEHPSVTLPLRADGKLDVGGCVGKEGTFTVIRDDGDGIPFVGTSPLVSGEIAEDLSASFLTSEQRPTAVARGVRVGADGTCLGAGGVVLQPLPGAGEEALLYSERTIAQFSNISALIGGEGAAGVLARFGVKGADVRDVRFACHCSRERAAAAVLAMGEADARALLAERGTIGVHCAYCNTEYTFDGDDLHTLFGETP